MQLAIAGQSVSGCPTNYLIKMQHHSSNVLTSSSFAPPPKKNPLERLVEWLVKTLIQKGDPDEKHSQDKERAYQPVKARRSTQNR